MDWGNPGIDAYEMLVLSEISSTSPPSPVPRIITTSGGLGRYLLWKEILPGSRLDLLLEADLEKDWMGYLGLLLEWNNRKEAAERIWQEMDFETLQDLLNDLKSSENPSEESTNP